MTLELDHIFVFVRDGAAAEQHVATCGLRETYRRTHPGQGTANICCAFENAFVEFLWLVNEAEASSLEIAPTGLLERARWRESGACPFGIAWRGTPLTSVPTWRYAPPYLPRGLFIATLDASRDPRQPLMFASPGKEAPAAWAPERRGDLQRRAGRHSICRARVYGGDPPAPHVRAVAEPIGVTFAPSPTWSLEVDIATTSGTETLTLLPS